MFGAWEAECKEYEAGMYGLEDLSAEGYREAFLWLLGLLEAWNENMHTRDQDIVKFIEGSVIH